MGAYLYTPVRDKISEDGEGKDMSYGASSMQGWRISQEVAIFFCLDRLLQKFKSPVFWDW